MTYFSGSVKANISGSVADISPSSDAISIVNKTGATSSVPEGKKWVITSMAVWGATTSPCRIVVNIGAVASATILESRTAYNYQQLNGVPLMVLSAGDDIITTITSGVALITYFEVTA